VLPVLLGVDPLGFFQDAPHFFFQPRLRPVLVECCVARHPPAVQRHSPHLRQSRLLAQPQHLHEQRL
jgi:hypothetical protein